MIHLLENHLHHILDEYNKMMLGVNALLHQGMNMHLMLYILNLLLLKELMMELKCDCGNFHNGVLMGLREYLSNLETFFFFYNFFYNFYFKDFLFN